MSTIDSGLIASYLFDGNALDSLGMYPGTNFGARPTFNRFGQGGSALDFDGDEDYVNLGLDFLSYDSLTISLWIFPRSHPDSIFGDQYFICSGEPDVSSGIYGIWKEASLMVGNSTTSSNTQNNFHSILPPNNWHHLTLVFDRIEEVSKTYINGILTHSEIYEVGSNTDPLDSLIIGAANFSSSNSFKGGIDDLLIYNRTLSPLEILSLYNLGCSDTITLNDFYLTEDTLLFARSLIGLDTAFLDSAHQIYLVAPTINLDSSIASHLSEINILAGDGCNQIQAAHKNHFLHKGIYINNFVTDNILGESLKEDSLLAWCSHHQFNNIYLYNIGTALSMGKQSELDAFVEKAHMGSPSISVTFVSAGFGTSFSNIEAYHDDYSNIPIGIVSEIEFWNGSKSYDVDFAPWITKLNSLKEDTVTLDSIVRNPDLIRRFYIGKVKNGGGSPSLAIAENLVIHHDEIFLTNYHSNGYNLSTSTSTNSIRNKMSLLGEAAYNLSKKVNIVILFNVRQDSPAPNIWDYFSETSSNNEFENAYDSFYYDFLEADDIDFKEYINLKGFGIYRHSDAKVARLAED